MTSSEQIVKSYCKALSVFFLLEKSMFCLQCQLSFKSSGVSVLLHGRHCWWANVDSSKSVESVQKPSLKWVCSDQNSTYEEHLSKVENLALCIHAIALCSLSKCITGFHNFDFDPYSCMRDCPREILSCSEMRFDYCKTRKHRYEQNFFRAVAFVNRLPTSIDIANPTGLKQNPIRFFFWSFFNYKYNELVSATWRL